MAMGDGMRPAIGQSPAHRRRLSSLSTFSFLYFTLVVVTSWRDIQTGGRRKKPIWSFYLRWQLTRVDSTLPDKNHSRSFVWITHTHRVGSLFNPFPERKSFFLFFFFFFIDLSYSGHCVKSISATTNVTAADASGFQIKMCVSNRKETRVAVNWNPRSWVSFWTRLAVSKRFPLYWKIFPASVSNSGFVSHRQNWKSREHSWLDFQIHFWHLLLFSVQIEFEWKFFRQSNDFNS